MNRDFLKMAFFQFFKYPSVTFEPKMPFFLGSYNMNNIDRVGTQRKKRRKIKIDTKKHKKYIIYAHIIYSIYIHKVYIHNIIRYNKIRVG